MTGMERTDPPGRIVPGDVTPGLAPGDVDLGFTRPVPRDGYAWWYVDALSDDGRHGLTIIAFIGSVFSPYYAWSRRKGRGDPTDHCSVNVVLTGPGGNRWCMTERGRSALKTAPDHIAIGPSAMHWDGNCLTVEIEEMGVPVPQRVRGRVRLYPSAISGFRPTLDPAGRHRWWPIAPLSQVEVSFDKPDLAWSGAGYFDSNRGDEPLEAAFRDWDWCRGNVGDGAAILYNVNHRDGGSQSIAVRIRADGTATRFEPPPRASLPPCRWWRIGRETRCEDGGTASVRETLVDAPFYARSVVDTRLLGQRVTAMHESLSMDRFTAPWVQMLLPFRMPRRGG